MSRIVRIAVIGCGQIAFSHHGLAYRKYAAEHPGTILAACCDLDAERGVRIPIFRPRRFMGLMQ